MLLAAVTLLGWRSARGADTSDQRGATNQRNLRRPAANKKTGEAPIFSPIPEGGSFSITNPIIMITPSTLDFGYVPMGKSATNSFMVENVGHGKLSGTASVAAPFKIDSGATYTIREKEVQMVTLIYSPTNERVDIAPVSFTAGGTTLKATAVGRRLPARE